MATNFLSDILYSTFIDGKYCHAIVKARDVYDALIINKYDIDEFHEIWGAAPFIQYLVDIEYLKSNKSKDFDHNDYLMRIIYSITTVLPYKVTYTILENHRDDKISWHVIFSGKYLN